MFGSLKGGTETDSRTKWIDAAEQLPQAMVPVLVFVPRLQLVTICWFDQGGAWYHPRDGAEACGKVTHWQPLPAPPEVGL